MMKNTTDNQPTIDIYSLIKPYVTRWYWFLISIFLFIFLSILYTRYITPIYSIKSAVLIKDAKKSLSNDVGNMGVLEGLSGFGGMGTSSIENELEIFKTKKLMRDVVENYHLQTSIYNTSNVNKTELFAETSPLVIHIVKEKKNSKFPKKPFVVHIQKNGVVLESEEFEYKKNIEFGKYVSLPFADIIIEKNKKFDSVKADLSDEAFEVKFSTLEATATSLQSMLNIDLAEKDATVINISMDYPQVEKAQAIVNGLITAYNRDAILDKNSESQKTKEFIDERIKIISNELGNVETEKERFKTDNNITDLLTESKINLESSAEAKKKQIELDSQLELTNNLISYVSKQDSYQLLPVNIGLDNSESNGSIAAYNKMVLDRNRLLENATPQNPLIVDVTKQINSMKRSVAESLQKNKTALQFALAEYVSEQNDISSKIRRVPLQEKLFRSLERQQQIKENLYLILLQKREETAISLAVVAPKARIVEPPFVSDKLVAPNKGMILLTFILFGTLIPLAIIYTKELFNTKIVDKNDLKQLSKIPVIAEIPSINKNIDHLVKQNDFSPLAESFRILITNLSFLLDSNNESKVIFVTSSVKGEGKTFVSMNLALTFAASEKVIIIGADIRNPQLQRYKENKTVNIGLTEYLHDTSMSPERIIFQNSLNEKSDIIYSGTIPPNPAELLKNGRLGVLLDYLKTKYKYIIVDTAPLLLVTDTITIADYADLKLYVTRSNYTERGLIEFANETVETGKLKNVAFVLNDVKKEDFGYGNKYGYGYNNK